MAESALLKKLVQIYENISHVEKKGYNKSQNYHYMRAADMVNTVRSEFIKAGIYAEINFDFTGPSYTIARSKEPSAPFSAVNVRCTIVLHDSLTGETVTASGLGSGADTGDKSSYKAQTGALKYALRNALLIPDENADPEADESVDEVPDFQEARHAEPKKAAPKQNPTPAAPVKASSETSTAPSTPSVPKAEIKEPAPVQQTLPGTQESAALPNEDQMNDFRKRFSKLGDDLADAGKLKSSRNKPINRKILAFMLSLPSMPADASQVTTAQWERFFTYVDRVKTEKGIRELAEKIEEVNK